MESAQWIDQIAKEFEITVDRDGKAALIKAIGCNLSQTHSELEKLKLYIHPETKVLKKHVDELVLKTSGDDVFAFTDQVINRDLKKAYPTLAHLMEEGTVPLVLLTMLVPSLQNSFENPRWTWTKNGIGPTRWLCRHSTIPCSTIYGSD